MKKTPSWLKFIKHTVLLCLLSLPVLAKSEGIQIDASSLYDEYKDNEVAADAKYKGKIIEVTGEIDHVSSSYGESSITLGGVIGVTCYFSKSEEGVLANLSKGQNVTVRGMVKGKMMGVNLKDCKVISPGISAPAEAGQKNDAASTKPAEISSEDLDAAYDANEVKADSQYKGKTILIKGTITKIDKDLFDKTYVELHGRSDFLGVQCYVTQAAHNKLADMSVGTEVHLKGTVKGKSMIVELESCDLVNQSGETPKNDSVNKSEAAPNGNNSEITAEDLDTAYDANEVKADNQYKGKTIIIKGTITKIAKDLFDKTYVELRGKSTFLGLQCYVTPAAQSKLGDMTVGTEVRLKGKVKGKMMIVILESCDFVQ